MRLRLPFVYELDRWSERTFRRGHRWAEVQVDISEVDRFTGPAPIRIGATHFYRLNGRLFRLWLYGDEQTVQASIDAMLRGEVTPELPEDLPVLPYMFRRRMHFVNAASFDCLRSDERPTFRPGEINLIDERAEEARSFYPLAMVYSPPGLWVEADEPVLSVRPLAPGGLYAVEAKDRPALASAGYHFRLDRLPDARAFVAEALRGHWLEGMVYVDYEPALLARSDMNRLAACVLASAPYWEEKPDLVAALMANDPGMHAVAMDAARERVLALAGRRKLDSPLQQCAVTRWFFEEEQAL